MSADAMISEDQSDAPHALAEIITEIHSAGSVSDIILSQTPRLVELFRSDRVTIYSVGPDGSDDGGDVAPGPKGKRRTADTGFRLLDPSSRAFRVASEAGPQ